MIGWIKVHAEHNLLIKACVFGPEKTQQAKAQDQDNDSFEGLKEGDGTKSLAV